MALATVALGNASIQEADVASAATCDLGAATKLRVRITGTTAITSFGTGANVLVFGRFADRLLLAHNATTLILPGGVDIWTAAGDTFIAASDASGNWRVHEYVKANGIALRPALVHSKVAMWDAVGNATTINAFGMANPSATGTATAVNVATTNLYTTARRLSYISAATANARCGARLTDQMWHRGNVAKAGGFDADFRFGVGDAATVANSAIFTGFIASTALIGTVDPSTLTDIVALAADKGDANLSIMHNDGSGAATEVALGANFPAQTLSTDLYDFKLFATPNGSAVYYRVERLNTGDVAVGALTTDLPSATTFLAPQLWRTNGSTTSAVTLDLCHVAIHTDF